jgi:hypothetical protein
MEVFDFETLSSGGVVRPYCLTYTAGSDTVFVRLERDDPEYVCELILSSFKPNTVYYAHNLLFDCLLFFGGVLSKNLKYR